MTPNSIIESVAAYYDVDFVKDKRPKAKRAFAVAVYLVKTKFSLNYIQLKEYFKCSDQKIRFYFISVATKIKNEEIELLKDIDSINKIYKFKSLEKKDLIAKACQMYAAQYLSISEISKKIGVSQNTVSYMINRHWFGKRKFTENSKYITLKSKV